MGTKSTNCRKWLITWILKLRTTFQKCNIESENLSHSVREVICYTLKGQMIHTENIWKKSEINPYCIVDVISNNIVHLTY